MSRVRRRACVCGSVRACVSLARGTVMNRGCVFASRDLARCGTLQKCGQAVAAAEAAETASQEPSPASPTSQRCGRTLGESLQTSSGRGEDAGSPSGWTGGCAGARPAWAPSLCRLPGRQGCPQPVGTRPGGDVGLGGHSALAPGAEVWRVARPCSRPLPPPSVPCSPASALLPAAAPVTAAAPAARGSSGLRDLTGRFPEPLKLLPSS